jgi:transposase InsO family protein
VNLARLIAAQRDRYGIPHAVSCRALGVSPAWFYKWRRGDCSVRRARRQALAGLIAYLFRLHHGTYGSPRIHADLVELGWAVSKNTVAAVMAEQGLVARRKLRRRGLTRADRSARKAPDGLRRDFAPPADPDVAWVGDLTDIPNAEGVLYLAAILDLHSRRCVGFAMGPRHDTGLAKAALQVAIAIRGGSVAGVLMHTDQGGEYTGEVFKLACAAAGITQSMGRTGSALDNAVAEAFNSTLEVELLSRCEFATREQARHAVASWIDDYNTIRRHSTANMMSPVDYERARAQQRAEQRRADTSKAA